MQRFFKSHTIASTAFVAGLPLFLLKAGRAETADWVIRARYVVTMDSQHRIVEDGAVAIAGQRIVAVGPSTEIGRKYQAQQTLDRRESLVMPGFIDTHTHAAMSLFRAIADDRLLQDWLTNYIFPAESKNVSPEFVKWGTRLACLEMSLAGITTYTDMYYFEEMVAETTRVAGIRGVLGQTVIGFPAPDYKNWHDTIAATEQYIKRFQHDSLIVPAVAPHSIYTTPNDALVASHNLAAKYHVPLVIHLSETKKEVDDAMAQRHMTPTEVLDRLGVLDSRVVAAHGVWESDSDIEILKRKGTGIAHCPTSNTKLASGIAPIVKMLRAGVTLGFGTDGFAGSNDSADLMMEMSLAAKLQKVTNMDPQVLPAEQVVELATMGGARVLGLEKEIGSLEPGKRADLITIALDRPNMIPLYNVYSQIVYTSKPGDVRDVFVNGKEIVSERRMLTLNSTEVLSAARDWKARIKKSIDTGSEPGASNKGR